VRVKPQQLSQQLQGPLKPVYMVSGEEPLLVQESVDEIRKAARAQGFDERQSLTVEKGFDWATLLEEANTLSLFASRRIIELKLPSGKPGTEGSKRLVEYLDNCNEDTVLIIEAGKIDRSTLEKSKWCKTIDQKGVITQVWPVKPNEMLGFMRQRTKRLKLNIENDALALLSSRLEGNLLAAMQELDKLLLLHGSNPITVGMIFDEVKDSARYDVFDLSKAMLAGDTKQSLSIAHHLHAEDAPLTLLTWAISKEARLLEGAILAIRQNGRADDFLQKKRVFKQQQGDYLRAAQRLKHKTVVQALAQLKHLDDVIKGKPAEEPPWAILERTVLALSTH